MAASHRVGDGANDQSRYGARYQPHRNGRLNYPCPDTQAIGDDCYRRDISRDRKLAKRDQSGQQEQSSLWGRIRGGYIGISHNFILSAMPELSPEVGDGGNRQGGISWGCLTPPLLHRRNVMHCHGITFYYAVTVQHCHRNTNVVLFAPAHRVLDGARLF